MLNQVSKQSTTKNVQKHIVKKVVISQVSATLRVDDEWNEFLSQVLTPQKDMTIDVTHSLDEIEIVEEDIDISTKNVSRIEYEKCPVCNVPGKIQDVIIICEQCGLERAWDYPDENDELFSASILQSYNTSSDSYMSFNIVGTNSYCYHRSLLKTCADYTAFRTNSNRKEIFNRITSYNGNKIPINIINQTADIFDIIKRKNYVFRGNGKWGIIGAALYYMCAHNNLTRTEKLFGSVFSAP
jgi:hypothetical protein